jgi:hypothetical protein
MLPPRVEAAMTRLRTLIPASILLLNATGMALANGRFEHLAVYLEQTIEDEDCEIAFEAISGTGGLTALKVLAPNGRVVIDFKAPDSRLGMRQIVLESPEPKNDGRLQAEFPPGAYHFTGTLPTGANIEGEATLSHAFPGTARALQPRADQHDVPIGNMQIKWKPVSNASAYVLTVEHEKTGQELRATLAGNATTFTIPEGFLAPGLQYKLAISTVGKDGNRTVSEIAFTTAAKK